MGISLGFGPVRVSSRGRVSVGGGLGPVRASVGVGGWRRSRGGSTRPSRARSSASVAQEPGTPRVAMTPEQLRTAFRVDWVWVLGGSLFALATPYTAALIPVAVVLVALAHRRTRAQRANETKPATQAPSGPVCPVTEARRAEAMGWTESARMWRGECDRIVSDAPTQRLPRVR